MNNIFEQSLPFGEYGVTREQACIMCHLSGESDKCALRYPNENLQVCSQPFREHESQRWDAWMYLIGKGQPLESLRRFIPRELRKKFRL